MKTITTITVLERCFFVQNGRLRQAEPGDVLVLHESPVFGRRDIDAETARRMILAERAEPGAFAGETVVVDPASNTTFLGMEAWPGMEDWHG